MLKLDDNTFVNYVQFKPGVELVVQYCVLGKDALNIKIHSHNENVIYVSFLQWLYWIFAEPGTY